MTHGVLFRGAEGKIRQGMLAEDLFEVVIGLAPNLFYGTGIPASVLVLNRAKPPARRGAVLFIDASEEFEEGTNQNRLRDRDLERIVRTFHAWNLNITRYVDTAEEEERIDVVNKQRHRPHFHAKYQDREVVVSIPDGDVLDGSFPNSKMKLLDAWIELHRDELMADWELTVSGQNPYKIDPLR